MTQHGRLRVLIVDDEHPARQHLQRLLENLPDVEVVGAADSGVTAVTAIRAHDPDVVFMDIQMPGMTGLEVAREIGPEYMPSTIFVTACDHYALQAFELAALDYLLKPYDDERFVQALQRARRMHELQQSGAVTQQIRQALEAVGLASPEAELARSSQGHLERMAVESRGQTRVVLVEQIDYVTASGVYAELHVGDRVHVVRERMQILESRLDPRHFLRIHRSIIVQLSRIDVLLRQAGGDYTLKLLSGIQLPVSRNRIDQLERWMGVLRHDAHP